MTAPGSPAGSSSPVCGRCRGYCWRSSPGSRGEERSACGEPAAPTPGFMPRARSPTASSAAGWWTGTCCSPSGGCCRKTFGRWFWTRYRPGSTRSTWPGEKPTATCWTIPPTRDPFAGRYQLPLSRSTGLRRHGSGGCAASPAGGTGAVSPASACPEGNRVRNLTLAELRRYSERRTDVPVQGRRVPQPHGAEHGRHRCWR